MRYRFILSAFSGLFFAFGAFASDLASELHVVTVNQGNIRTGDRIHGPEVKISVTRPDATVALALSSRHPVRFLVTLDETTELGPIYLFGRGATKSEVMVNGAKSEVRTLEKLRGAFRPNGVGFRKVVKDLTDLARLDRVSSFQAVPKPPTATIVVDAILEEDVMKAVYLLQFVQPDGMSEALRPYLTDTPPEPAATFTSDGFVLTENGVQRSFPITLDVPPVSWPVAAAFDPKTRRIYGVTLGGEGFLYVYDIETDAWSVATSMDNNDATGMLFDPSGDRLIIAVNRSRDGLLRTWSDETGLQRLTLGIKISDLPGLTDLFTPGGGEMPILVPLALDGNDLLVRTYPPQYRPNRRQDIPWMSRTYVFNMATGEAALVAYEGD